MRSGAQAKSHRDKWNNQPSKEKSKQKDHRAKVWEGKGLTGAERTRRGLAERQAEEESRSQAPPEFKENQQAEEGWPQDGLALGRLAKFGISCFCLMMPPAGGRGPQGWLLRL